MRSILSMLAIVALTAFAVPAMAQQETNTGQAATDAAQTADKAATDAGKAVDNAATDAGKAVDNAATDAGKAVDNAATDAAKAVDANKPSEVAPTTPTTQTAQPTTPSEGVTERAATTTEREEGGAMPTTASSLPGFALVGILLIGAGMALRYMSARGRS